MLFILQDCLGCVDIIHILREWLGIIQIFSQLIWNAESFSWHKIVISWGNSHTFTKPLGTYLSKVIQTYQDLQLNPIHNLHAHAPHINANSWLLITPRSFSQRTFHKLQLSKFFLGRKTIHTECINICMYLLPIISASKIASTHLAGNCLIPDVQTKHNGKISASCSPFPNT